VTNANNSSVDQRLLVIAMASFVQIGAILILVYWCFTIVSPFVPVVFWGLIIGVAIYPMHVAFSARLGGREKLSATVLVLIHS
jgi:predicted PurR-regulated permease PerM